MKRVLCMILTLVMTVSSTAFAGSIAVPNVLEHPGDHRPVPTVFEKSKSYDDLHFFPMAADADTTFNSLTGGKVVLTNDDLFYEGATKEGTGKYGKVEVVPVEGMPFDKALRFTTNEVPSGKSAFNYRIYPDDFEAFRSYKDYDMCIAKFYVRNIEGGDFDAKTNRIYTYFCEKSFNTKVPGDNRPYRTIDFGSEWTVAYVPVQLTHAYGQYGYIFSLNPVYYEGVMEVGGFELINYGDKYDYADMPVMNSYYKGCEEDAQWRKEAFERIDKYRKGDFNITVRDKNGNPVPDAKINLDMYEHEFDFSVAVSDGLISKPEYRKVVTENFNHLGAEGHFHRRDVNEDENKYFKNAEAFIDFAKNNGINGGIHGHALLWDNSITSSYLSAYKDVYQDEALLKAELKKHFEYMANRFGDDVTVWDVSNEDGSRIGGPTCTFKNMYGKEFLVDLYNWARELFPDATLMITDGGFNYKRDFTDWAVENLKPDMLGVQGHASYASIPEDAIKTLFDYYDRYGLEMKITEFDSTNIKEDPNYQGNIARDMLIAYFSVPHITMIQLWGFWDSSSKQGSPRLMYKNDWTIKPGGIAFQDLVYNKWWTNEEGTTDNGGKYSVRGFYGDYDLKINADGKEYLLSLPLYKDSKNDVEITLGEKEATAIIKDTDTKVKVVISADETIPNEAMVMGEYGEGNILKGVTSSKGETIIQRNEFLIGEYERKNADTELKLIVLGDDIKTSSLK